ncbi:hypothetical protein K474DRAFT_1755891 [Panus rudis PR-1116 ss-1]|nr:hypothetical protein K474DRAFT_1755891 [Panus rudis PR-1116 ss-1]
MSQSSTPRPKDPTDDSRTQHPDSSRRDENAQSPPNPTHPADIDRRGYPAFPSHHYAPQHRHSSSLGLLNTPYRLDDPHPPGPSYIPYHHHPSYFPNQYIPLSSHPAGYHDQPPQWSSQSIYPLTQRRPDDLVGTSESAGSDVRSAPRLPRPTVTALGSRRAPPTDRPTVNPSPRDGVFSFEVDIVLENTKKNFSAETDMPYEDFRDRCVANLAGTPRPVVLGYKLTGDTGKPSELKDEAGFTKAMQQLSDKVLQPRRQKTVRMEVRNVTKKEGKGKGKKRGRPDSSDADDEAERDVSQLNAFKDLSRHTQCDKHQGHCAPVSVGGIETHRRLSHEEMTLWAKKISLSQATIWNPPHCLNFDRPPTKKRRSSTKTKLSTPHLHLTIENRTAAAPSSSASASIPEVTTAAAGIASSSDAGPSFALLPEVVTDSSDDLPSPHTLAASLRSSNQPSATTSECIATAVEHDTRVRGILESATESSMPPLHFVLETLDADLPGYHFQQYEDVLAELGILHADTVASLASDVLADVGAMGLERAERLVAYSRFYAAPFFGLRRQAYGTQYGIPSRRYENRAAGTASASESRSEPEEQPTLGDASESKSYGDDDDVDEYSSSEDYNELDPDGDLD